MNKNQAKNRRVVHVHFSLADFRRLQRVAKREFITVTALIRKVMLEYMKLQEATYERKQSQQLNVYQKTVAQPRPATKNRSKTRKVEP